VPKKSATLALVRPDLGAPPVDATQAIAWAILQRPDGTDVGEWLADLMPEGSWSQYDDELLANAIVGAALRARAVV
jgi:hypothetical protein